MSSPYRTTKPPASGGESIGKYIQRIQKYPLLSPEEEQRLARQYAADGDRVAADALVNSHLRLVAKIAMGYRGYNLPVDELIGQGNLGLVQAVERFDAERGFRLATYAMWWIRAAIQEFVIHSWSLVRMGTTSDQKKLFFNLRRIKSQIQAIEDGDLLPENLRVIAETLNIPEAEVVNMNRRLSRADASLNALVRADGESEWQDWLVDDSATQEIVFGDREEADLRRRLLANAIDTLSERERSIVQDRHLRDTPLTLEQLSKRFGISRERVRQIEVGALSKIKKHVARSSAFPERPSPSEPPRVRRSLRPRAA